ncbi:MAG: 4Fe-4S binding protein [Bdellovibrionota bacterium]
MSTGAGDSAVRKSLFAHFIAYLGEIFAGARSVMGSCATALPYFFSIGELRKEATEHYPDPISSRTADELPARTRGLLENDIERCTGCKECERICPVKCITVQNELGADSVKVWTAVFDIDLARCVFCGLCVEVCPPSSIKHTKKYEAASYYRADLVRSFGRGRVTPEQRAKWEMIRRALESEGESE